MVFYRLRNALLLINKRLFKINTSAINKNLNIEYKGKTMEQNLDSIATLIKEKKTDDLSFVKLHSTLCFLMTRFHKDQCPKLAHFIVSHIRLVIEHPDVVDSPNCKTLYLGLLQQWQNITAALLEQRRNLSKNGKITH
jgi:hypothetical protein